jgi:hypothetical protein
VCVFVFVFLFVSMFPPWNGKIELQGLAFQAQVLCCHMLFSQL